MKTTPLKQIPILLLALMLGGCTTAEQQRISKFMDSAAGKAIIGIAETAAGNAIDQFASSGKVNGKDIAKDAISGAAAELRKKQTPGTDLNPAAAKTAAKTAVNEGTGVSKVSSKVAPAVSSAVADAVKKGHPADLALEAAARGLDKAAASVNK